MPTDAAIKRKLSLSTSYKPSPSKQAGHDFTLSPTSASPQPPSTPKSLLQRFQDYRHKKHIDAVVTLQIHSLEKVGYTNGSFFVSYHIERGGRFFDLFEDHGDTPKAPVVERAVRWEATMRQKIKFAVATEDEDDLLQEVLLHLTVQRLTNDHDKSTVDILGTSTVNLAEYAFSSPATASMFSTRSYRLENTYAKSELKLTIKVDPMPTDIIYQVPPLNRRTMVSQYSDTWDDAEKERRFAVAEGRKPKRSFSMEVAPKAMGKA